MAGLRLNLGCGHRFLPGFVNVDLYGEPEVRHDLETFPWPWPDNAVTEIQMQHVLEHLGQDPKVYQKIVQELYRICEPNALVHIIVPHHRHDLFAADPTHVRVITPTGLMMLSERQNRDWLAAGSSNTPLAIYWKVNFELKHTAYKPSPLWLRVYAAEKNNLELLLSESALHSNLIEQLEMVLQVIK